MLFELGQVLRLSGASASRVVHVGAHKGEEVSQYLKYGADQITLIEQDSQLAASLFVAHHDDKRVTVIQATVGEFSGLEVPFWSALNGQSSSIFQPGLHLIEHPEVAFSPPETRVTRRLDELLKDFGPIDVINLDIQGAELAALKSLGEAIASVRLIYSEVNRKPLYRDIPLVPELDLYMEDYGFSRCATAWTRHGWGDAVYLNRKYFSFGARLRLRLLGVFRSISPKGVEKAFSLFGAVLRLFSRGGRLFPK